MHSPLPHHVNKKQSKPQTNGCGYIWDLITSENNPESSVDYCLMTKPSEKHKHNKTFEFYCIVKGTGTVYVGNKIFKVQPGSVIQIPPGYEHYTEPADKLELFVVNTPPFNQSDYIPI
jgi:mannose-6-phosphate isomerase-like protein (cupin superfamily)